MAYLVVLVPLAVKMVVAEPGRDARLGLVVADRVHPNSTCSPLLEEEAAV